VKRFFLFIIACSAAIAANAQTPPNRAADAGAQPVEVDPIRCWWRTSSGSVRIGEHFDLWLTCASLETDAVQVVPDQSHLGVEVAAMAPFEVVGGSHPADLRSGNRRFFQYQYVLRMINPDAIGKDVKIPDMVMHYKVNSRVAANTSIQGRDLTYVLPTEEVRVSSMVPADANDIRDSSGESFSIVDSLGLRAGVLEIVAITSVALGSLMLIYVLVRLARRGRRRTPADERLLPTRSVVSAAIRELNAVQRDREQAGWNDALAGRALAASRIAAATAVGRPVSQRIAGSPNSNGSGRILSSKAFRRKARALSSSVTPGDLAKRTPADPRLQPLVDELRESMGAFSQAQYGRSTEINQSALDTALASALSAAGRVKSEHSWLKTQLQRFTTNGAGAVESRA
jgi:hypothetical protein